MPDGGNEIRKGRKFEQVLAGARDVFMSVGFEGASVDDIARRAGVSKATLYSYFPDKRVLFMEVASIECNRQANQTLDSMDLNRPMAALLQDVAQEMVAFLTSPFAQRIFKICAGESDRFPELGRKFYESGPALVRDRMKALLQMGVDRAELEIADLDLAADQLAELCKVDLFPRMIFSVAGEFSEAERQRVADGAVEMFLARYGV